MKRWSVVVGLVTVLAAVGLVSMALEPAQAAVGSGTTTPSIEGTTWSGPDSDGDQYEYTFLAGGQLRFRTNTMGSERTYEDAGDYWAQNGRIVIMVTTKYATRVGIIDGSKMHGDAWNVREHRWTWDAVKQ